MNEKPKLMLTKKTVARLNNLEMRHVRGGDGDEGGNTGISMDGCDKNDDVDVKSILEKAAKVIISQFLKCM